ncbi:MAG: ATP-dependent helicase [Candidatus Thermoplasmatota archaeon]|nr:ATP-dependent helicase [Candidatus Thermoplasmatota archaeon]MCL5791148.1 ATP-dependent helicase [Candidatus Thermoplasmatota archaeon]
MFKTEPRINTDGNEIIKKGIEYELPFLDDVIVEWFNRKYDSLTIPQRKVIPLVHAGRNVLVSSPTGTGKTLTGFMAILNELFLKARSGELKDEILCVYISPLKALANDINKNLNSPLDEIYSIAREHGLDLPPIRVSVRSGDTPQSERQKMLRKPPHVLITTPESFSLALTAPKFKEKFTTVKYVIIDEIHEISSSKRGTLLSLNMERLEEVSPSYVRIGLSATQAPLSLIAQFLCGFENGEPRKCEIVDVDIKRGLDLETITPVKDLTSAGFEVANERMYDIIAKLIEDHKTTLIFTNTRSATEHVAIRLKARGIESLEAHHSSLGKETRIDVEERLKKGELRCVISSTSLELGIDIGSIDLVIQIGSPKSVSKGLQRIGRAGHSIHELTMGRFVVFNLDDLVECSVLTRAAYDRNIDRVSIPEGALDVLSQAIVGMTLEKTWKIDECYEIIRRSFPYRNLSREEYMSVIFYLAGKLENNSVYSKIWYDEKEGTIGRKKSTRMIYFMNVGTIPDDSDYRVIDINGRHLGQLSDKFVERMVPGDIFVLGARTYSFIKSRGNRVIVRDATGLKPTIPSWTGEMLPRSYDLGEMIGRFREKIAVDLESNDTGNIEEWLREKYHVDQNGARSIVSYVRAQKNFGIPTDRHLLVEGYIDENLFSAIFLIPLGRRVNDALSRAYAQAVSNRYEISTRVTVTDDGFMLTFERKINLKELTKLINSNNFVDYVKKSIFNTTVFKERFRQCATRSLMVLRRYKGHEVSVVMQQLRSDKVLRALENIPNFPVVTETYREIMNDMMDVPSALAYVSGVIDKDSMHIREYSNESSPFSLSLVLAGVSDVVLMEDRAKLLRELQSRIVDKTYGSEYMDFKIREPSRVEAFYTSKVKRIENRDDLIDLFEYFPFVDISRSRFNSPFPYTGLDVAEMCRELANEGRIRSVYVRGIYWTLPDRVHLFKNLFWRMREAGSDDLKVLEDCNLRTMAEISRETGLAEDAVKNSLASLESMYLIERKFRGDRIVYARSVESIPGDYSAENLVYDTLKSMGPMTSDELSIKLPMDREILEECLVNLKNDSMIIEDYITPVFAKQYMIKGDLEKILGMESVEPSEVRLGKFMRQISSAEEYFDSIGFYTNIESMTMRIRDADRRQEPDGLISGRFFRHRYTVMNRNLGMALQKLREDDTNEQEDIIYEFLKYGRATAEAISRGTSIPIKEVKQVLKSLEFRVLISSDGNTYGRLPESGLDRNEAMQVLLKFIGPATQREIMRSFWFNIRKEDLNGITVTHGRDGAYYGEPVKNDAEEIILPVSDPVMIFMGRLVTENSGFTHAFYSRGKLNAIMNLTIMPEALWIDQIEFEQAEAQERFCSYLDREYISKEMSVLVTEPVEKIRLRFVELGYRESNGILIKGSDSFIALYMDSLFKYSVISYGNSIPKSGRVLDNIYEAYLGIRDNSEATMWGIKTVDLESYFASEIIFSFNGPLGLTSKGTLETVSLYRTLRNTVLTEIDHRVLKFIMEYPASEEEIIGSLAGQYENIRESIQKLWAGGMICRDARAKYRFVVEKFTMEEAAHVLITKIISVFGYVNYDMFRKISLCEDQAVYDRAMKKISAKRKLSRIFILDAKMFISATDTFMTQKPGKGREVIISPRDLIYAIFKNTIKSNFGGTRMFLYIVDGSPVLSMEARRSKNDLAIENFNGDMTRRRECIRALSEFGYSVKFDK